MIKSMTGYGKSIAEVNYKKINIEIKSLNSKQADISMRIPSAYKEKESELRSIIGNELERGKIEFLLYVDQVAVAPSYLINKELFKKYYFDLKKIANELNEQTDLIKIITQLPDVFSKEEKVALDETEWKSIESAAKEAIAHINEFRLSEGAVLQKELSSRIKNIAQLLSEVSNYEKERITIVRERILTHLNETNLTVNQDRLEQELIFYIEKYDITEEKLRLKTHLDYFEETMLLPDGQGKKLGFISQEIGREINTLGSKANHAELQKIVVEMKDELEKIKEQTLNVL
ncbi:MAG: YicC family protein [Bacteroidetes bacterium HGW-Bacteroidetes-12]|nr:MAG: YicC family protein [Bacteroidetes bacterium HGW-Bacteroidetes-12]